MFPTYAARSFPSDPSFDFVLNGWFFVQEDLNGERESTRLFYDSRERPSLCTSAVNFCEYNIVLSSKIIKLTKRILVKSNIRFQYYKIINKIRNLFSAYFK